MTANRILFRRAITNLVDNALRHTPAGGSINVVVNGDAASLRIAIVDTGRGIAPEQMPHIFDRFYTSGYSMSADTQGTGLGLSIVKSIVERHGGQISVSSTANAGTAVTIVLPADTTAERRRDPKGR